jgi:prepilin-type N-terminal cleavage/methylation domain-containing protein
MKKNSHKGFTLLEFLVVMVIMAILIGLILVGLTAARANARDESRIADLHTIAVGLEQYHDVCREYPADLVPSQNCGSVTLESFIPNIASFHFNQTPTAEYQYIPIAADSINTGTCVGYHLYVHLETDHNAFTGAKFNSSNTSNVEACMSQNPGEGIDASTTPKIFDLHK